MFSPSTGRKTISVPLRDDPDFEQDELFFVKLSEPRGATLGDSLGVGTIANREDEEVSLLAAGGEGVDAGLAGPGRD